MANCAAFGAELVSPATSLSLHRLPLSEGIASRKRFLHPILIIKPLRLPRMHRRCDKVIWLDVRLSSGHESVSIRSEIVVFYMCFFS